MSNMYSFKPVPVCPYCGSAMHIGVIHTEYEDDGNEKPVGYAFECPECESSSPIMHTETEAFIGACERSKVEYMCCKKHNYATCGTCAWNVDCPVKKAHAKNKRFARAKCAPGHCGE